MHSSPAPSRRHGGPYRVRSRGDGAILGAEGSRVPPPSPRRGVHVPGGYLRPRTRPPYRGAFAPSPRILRVHRARPRGGGFNDHASGPGRDARRDVRGVRRRRRRRDRRARPRHGSLARASVLRRPAFRLGEKVSRNARTRGGTARPPREARHRADRTGLGDDVHTRAGGVDADAGARHRGVAESPRRRRVGRRRQMETNEKRRPNDGAAAAAAAQTPAARRVATRGAHGRAGTRVERDARDALDEQADIDQADETRAKSCAKTNSRGAQAEASRPPGRRRRRR